MAREVVTQVKILRAPTLERLEETLQRMAYVGYRPEGGFTLIPILDEEGRWYAHEFAAIVVLEEPSL